MLSRQKEFSSFNGRVEGLDKFRSNAGSCTSADISSGPDALEASRFQYKRCAQENHWVLDMHL